MLGISQCLMGCNCTYKGGHNYQEELYELFKENCVMICPEVLGGLSIPRDPSEIIGEDPLRIETIHHKDVTKEYLEGAHKALQILKDNDVHIVILKSRSPSCGVDEIYDGTFQHHIINKDGIFTRLCKENHIQCFTEENWKEGINNDNL